MSTTAPFKFKMADFNQDGVLDIGMILQQEAFGTDLIATALGNGNGTFQAVRTQTGSSVLENLRISNDLEPGDVNGDGRPDLVVFNDASNDVSVFIVNPDGSLRPHQRYGIGNTPILGTLADFDGDTRLDVAAAIGLPPSGLHNAVVILRNIGGPAGTPTPTPTATASATATAYSNAHANFDRESNANTECDAQFDSNSYAEFYTQANSHRKTKGYAEAEANSGSSTLNKRWSLPVDAFATGHDLC